MIRNGSPRARALRTRSSWKNEGRGTSRSLAQPDQQRGVAFIQHQPGGLGDLGELAGQIDQPLVVPVGPGGQHQQPTGAQQRMAAGKIPRGRPAGLGWLTRPRLPGSGE